MRNVLAALGVLAAASAAAVAQSGALAQLKVAEPLARETFLESLASGGVDKSVGRDAFIPASGAVRAQLASGAIAWAKAFTKTAAFTSEYATLRESRKPAAPVFEGTPEDELKARRAKENKQLEDAKKQLAGLPPDLRRQAEENLRASLGLMETPEMQQAQLQQIRDERKQQTEAHAKAMTVWEANLPANPSALIAARLSKFLEVSATVDFNAKLVEKDGRKFFADPALEAKSADWKLCYRAGREAVQAARAAAQAWLGELGSAR
jgi:hypothetical protein